MNKLFKAIPSDELRSVRFAIRATEAEAADIRQAASIRNLSVADYIRRAALGRKADVRIETDIILGLGNCVQAIRDLRTNYLEKGFEPPTESMNGVVRQCTAAILRVGER